MSCKVLARLNFAQSQHCGKRFGVEGPGAGRAGEKNSGWSFRHGHWKTEKNGKREFLVSQKKKYTTTTSNIKETSPNLASEHQQLGIFPKKKSSCSPIRRIQKQKQTSFQLPTLHHFVQWASCIFGGCNRALYHSVTDLWGEDGEDVLTSPFESMGSFAWLINDAMLIKVKDSLYSQNLNFSIPNSFTKVLPSIVDTYK